MSSTPDYTYESTDLTESVERFIAAPAADIFALLADPSRHKDIDGSGTVVKSKEPSRTVAMGDTFGMDMKKGLGYSMVNTIIEFEQDQRIAWQTKPPKGLMEKMIGGRIWRYELTPAEGGTRVKETWDISKEKVPAAVKPLRGSTKKALQATLDRIATLVES
jgi:uncharacterized protein YndB with AHSA1/START domain